jgi:hypothetical protein
MACSSKQDLRKGQKGWNARFLAGRFGPRSVSTTTAGHSMRRVKKFPLSFRCHPSEKRLPKRRGQFMISRTVPGSRSRCCSDLCLSRRASPRLRSPIGRQPSAATIGRSSPNVAPVLNSEGRFQEAKVGMHSASTFPSLSNLNEVDRSLNGYGKDLPVVPPGT